MSGYEPGSPEDQAYWLERARESSGAGAQKGAQRARQPSSRPRGRDRRRRAAGPPLTTYGTALMSPLDMERYVRSGRVTGWTEASADTVDWLLANREATTVLRSPDGKRAMRVGREVAEELRTEGWR